MEIKPKYHDPKTGKTTDYNPKKVEPKEPKKAPAKTKGK